MSLWEKRRFLRGRSVTQIRRRCYVASPAIRSGGSVWDGTSRDVREHFPTHRDQLRFVQYDSCRGLEGWTVINFQLDTLWDYKRGQWFSEDHIVDDLYRNAEETASQHASRWVMIRKRCSDRTLTGQAAVVLV
jgi:hypothetical protein